MFPLVVVLDDVVLDLADPGVSPLDSKCAPILLESRRMAAGSWQLNGGGVNHLFASR